MTARILKIPLDENDQVTSVSCIVRESTRARRINLKIQSKGKVILTLPRRVSLQEGMTFLNQKKEWIKKRISTFPPQVSLSEYFLNGGLVWLTEHPRSLSLNFIENYSKPFQEISFDEIKFNVPIGECLNETTVKLLRNLAKDSLTSRLTLLAKGASLAWEKVRIGNQKSRWGSCSERKTISLNWRLILLPYEVGNYVIFHELAHLKHLNHSKEFWGFLEKLCPNARNLDAKLRTFGKTIISLNQRD